MVGLGCQVLFSLHVDYYLICELCWLFVDWFDIMVGLDVFVGGLLVAAVFLGIWTCVILFWWFLVCYVCSSDVLWVGLWLVCCVFVLLVGLVLCSLVLRCIVDCLMYCDFGDFGFVLVCFDYFRLFGVWCVCCMC